MKRVRSAFPRVNAPLLAALVLSVLAHLLILFGHRIDLSREPDVVRLEAILARTPPDAKAGQAPVPKEPPKKAVPKPRPKPAPQPAVAEAEDPPVETPPPPQPEPEQQAEAAPQPEVPPPPPEPPQTVGNAWPRLGVIKYLLFGGEARDPNHASRAELVWEIAPDGQYSMKLESRDAMPFPSMPWFKISFSYASKGKMVEGMFQPDRYEESISVFQNIVVKFDWERKVVDFAGHSLPLAPGTQDYLSVIMQAGDPGFAERGLMLVATGRGIRQYQFESLGSGELPLPFGMTWKTQQLVGKTGNNDVRVWVATEKFNLPVQIKFVVNKVNYYLVASDIRVSRDAVTPPAAATAPAAENTPAAPTTTAAETTPATVTTPGLPGPTSMTPATLPERQN